MRNWPGTTACRISWPLCDAFDKCRGPLFNAYRYPIYRLYRPLIFMAPSLPVTGQQRSGLRPANCRLAQASKTRVCPYLACCPAHQPGQP